MRELTVYYCPKCGHYGFFQLSGNAVCPICSVPMAVLPIRYQQFMDLDHATRHRLISRQMRESNPLSTLASLDSATADAETKQTDAAILLANRRVARETTPAAGIAEKTARENAMAEEISRLRQKNKELEHTISWMHDMIWDLTHRLHSN